MPKFLISTREIEHVIDNCVSALPAVVTSSIVSEDAMEVLSVAMGYVSRRNLSELNVHRKLYDLAVHKFSPTRSMDIVNNTVYDLLKAFETHLENRFRLRLHYTTHYLHAVSAGLLIEEFDIPAKAHSFHNCPLCGTIEKKPHE